MKDLSGETLLNRFRLDHLENQDELGDRYAGLDLKRNLLVSVHILRASLPYDPNILAFQNDQLTLQTLVHPNIAPFYGLYQGPSQLGPDPGIETAFLVERYVEGPSLQELLLERRNQPASIQEAMIYLKALCMALGYAHHFGLVHCNVKPANIHLQEDGRPLLGGFGFARSADSVMSSTGLTGLPTHLAPEEIRRETVSPATDIYGVGLVLFEQLTGMHPFLGTRRPPLPPPAVEQLITAHLLQPPANPSELNPAIPGGLSQVILTALQKEPRERYQNMQEMLEIACAVTGYTPDEVPGRLAPLSTQEQTVIGSASWKPLRPEAEIPAPPVSTTPVEAVPTSPTKAVYSSSPEAPPILVSPTFAVDKTATAYTAPPPIASGDYLSDYPPTPQRNRKSLVAVIAVAIGLFVLLCAVIAMLAGPPFYRQLMGIPAGETATLPVLGATASATPVATLLPPSETPRMALPGLLESPTPAFSDTPLPTVTEIPTNTPTEQPIPPTPTTPTSFIVTIRNNTANPIYAFRNELLMGTDPIPPAHFIFYKSIPPGTHSFRFCNDIQGLICIETRQILVDRDLTITVP